MENINSLKSYQISIIDDKTETRYALQVLLESVQFNVETFTNAALFLEKNDLHKADCIIIDIQRPDAPEAALREYLKLQKKIDCPVIIITENKDISLAIKAMKAGVFDFILKPFNEQDLLETVQKSVSKHTMGEAALLRGFSEKLSLLSKREHQVSLLIAEGMLNKQIAEELKISVSTVEVHRKSLMGKLEVKNSAQFLKCILHTRF